MAGPFKLSPALLDPDYGLSAPEALAATLNARGLYHPTQFVLRLSPRVHELINAVPTGTYSASEIDGETIQAYSTYIHETVHWWQHVGSTAGLIFSLSYPGQTHTSLGPLRTVIAGIGPKKSLRYWAEQAALTDTYPSAELLGHANTAVNNAIDVEFYKKFVWDPMWAEGLFDDRYFESVGHGYHMAYGHALSMISSAADPEFTYLPKAPDWGAQFERLTKIEHVGFYHGSPIVRGPVGIQAIFEGQARFIQLQYLTNAAGGTLTCAELRGAGYLSGVYVKAFENFLLMTGADWPLTVIDPLVGLFLLICDLAINPTRGFPLDIVAYKDFIDSVDPGLRFAHLCSVVKSHPELRSAIVEYSRDEYISIAGKLTAPAHFDHPITALRSVLRWMDEEPGLQQIMKERETFGFDRTNLPVRVMLAHFCAFCTDKVRRPEFFCWAGTWMAGPSVSGEEQALFLAWISQTRLILVG
jgi:hypothetical protein